MPKYAKASLRLEKARWARPISGFVTYSMVKTTRRSPGRDGLTA